MVRAAPRGRDGSARIGNCTADFRVTAPNGPLSSPELLLQALRREVLPALPEVLEQPEYQLADISLPMVEIDLGHWPDEPDWADLRRVLAHKLRLALWPHLRPDATTRDRVPAVLSGDGQLGAVLAMRPEELRDYPANSPGMAANLMRWRDGGGDDDPALTPELRARLDASLREAVPPPRDNAMRQQLLRRLWQLPGGNDDTAALIAALAAKWPDLLRNARADLPDPEDQRLLDRLASGQSDEHLPLISWRAAIQRALRDAGLPQGMASDRATRLLAGLILRIGPAALARQARRLAGDLQAAADHPDPASASHAVMHDDVPAEAWHRPRAEADVSHKGPTPHEGSDGTAVSSDDLPLVEPPVLPPKRSRDESGDDAHLGHSSMLASRHDSGGAEGPSNDAERGRYSRMAGQSASQTGPASNHRDAGSPADPAQHAGLMSATPASDAREDQREPRSERRAGGDPENKQIGQARARGAEPTEGRDRTQQAGRVQSAQNLSRSANQSGSDPAMTSDVDRPHASGNSGLRSDPTRLQVVEDDLPPPPDADPNRGPAAEPEGSDVTSRRAAHDDVAGRPAEAEEERSKAAVPSGAMDADPDALRRRWHQDRAAEIARLAGLDQQSLGDLIGGMILDDAELLRETIFRRIEELADSRPALIHVLTCLLDAVPVDLDLAVKARLPRPRDVAAPREGGRPGSDGHEAAIRVLLRLAGLGEEEIDFVLAAGEASDQSPALFPPADVPAQDAKVDENAPHIVPIAQPGRGFEPTDLSSRLADELEPRATGATADHATRPAMRRTAGPAELNGQSVDSGHDVEQRPGKAAKPQPGDATGTIDDPASQDRIAPDSGDIRDRIEALLDAGLDAAGQDLRDCLSLILEAWPLEDDQRVADGQIAAQARQRRGWQVLLARLVANDADAARPDILPVALDEALTRIEPDRGRRERALRYVMARLGYGMPARDGRLQQKARAAVAALLDDVGQATLRRPAEDITSAPEQTGQELQVTECAGIVLLHPFLKLLFDRLGVASEKVELRRDGLSRALAALRLLDGRDLARRGLDPMHRLLLGLPDGAPPPSVAVLDDAAQELIEGLLRSVIGHWGRLGQTSPDGLRQTFLQRPGTLRFDEIGAHLRVTPGPFDMLMDGLPWSIGTVALPWMDQPCHVIWRDRDG